MKNIRIFIIIKKKLSVFGGEIFNILELACFHIICCSGCFRFHQSRDSNCTDVLFVYFSFYLFIFIVIHMLEYTCDKIGIHEHI